MRDSKTQYVPPSDLLIWQALHDKGIPGLRFSRDVLVGKHVISMCSRACKVAVEYNLPPISRRTTEDHNRISTLKREGFTIINVRSDDVYRNLNGLCDYIISVALKNAAELDESNVMLHDFAENTADIQPLQSVETSKLASGPLKRYMHKGSASRPSSDAPTEVVVTPYVVV